MERRLVKALKANGDQRLYFGVAQPGVQALDGPQPYLTKLRSRPILFR